MIKSKYLANKVLNHVLGVSAFEMPVVVHLALFSSIEGLEDGLLDHELGGSGYARRPLSMAAAVGKASTSSAAAAFDPATTDWGPLIAWAIMDAAVAGNVLYYGEMPKYGTPPDYKKVFSGDGFVCRIGDVVISES